MKKKTKKRAKKENKKAARIGKKKQEKKEKKFKLLKKPCGKKEKVKKSKKERKQSGRLLKKKQEKKRGIKLGRKKQEKKVVPALQKKAKETKTSPPVTKEVKAPSLIIEGAGEKAGPVVEKIQAPVIPKERDIIIDDKEKKRLLEKYKPDGILEKTKNKPLIEVKDLDSLLKKLKDETAVYILERLRKKDPALADKLFLGKTFNSEREFQKYLEEETAKLLISETYSLKGRVSELRKKGGDVNYSDFHIMQIPLKIKLFSASFDRKDFDVIITLLSKASEEVKSAEQAFSASPPDEE